MKKRFTAFLLVLMMLLGMLPVSAFAADPVDDKNEMRLSVSEEKEEAEEEEEATEEEEEPEEEEDAEEEEEKSEEEEDAEEEETEESNSGDPGNVKPNFAVDLRNQIKVVCTTPGEILHTKRQETYYELLDESYNDDGAAESAEGWSYSITLIRQKYVDDFNWKTAGILHTDSEPTSDITIKWNWDAENSSWVLDESTIENAEIKVTCPTQIDPEKTATVYAYIQTFRGGIAFTADEAAQERLGFGYSVKEGDPNNQTWFALGQFKSNLVPLLYNKNEYANITATKDLKILREITDEMGEGYENLDKYRGKTDSSVAPTTCKNDTINAISWQKISYQKNTLDLYDSSNDLGGKGADMAAGNQPQKSWHFDGSLSFYIVSYDDGVADGDEHPVTEMPTNGGDYIPGERITLTAPQRETYTFIGWEANTDQQIYKSDEVYTVINSNVTLTAKWAPANLSYTVNYLEKDSNKVLHEQKTQSGVTFETEISSAKEVIDIPGYTYDSADKESLTVGTGENVINLYYVKAAPDTVTFDFDHADEDHDAAITKTVKGNIGRNFEESFDVIVTPDTDREKDTMGSDRYIGTADVTYTNRTEQPFRFSPDRRAGTSEIPNGVLFFTEAGTYTYTVQEVKGSTTRMSYDTTRYTLTIRVGLDTQKNALAVTSWQFTNTEKDTPLNIVNTYRAYYPATPGGKPTLNTDDHYAYVVGYPDGTVQPNGNITRAEAATIFFRLLSDASRDRYWSTTNSYSDVKNGFWYNNAVSTLSNAGIISGYPDGTFRPDAPITRAEMAKIIAVFAKLDKSGNRFSDIAGHWAEAYIKLAAGNGWIAGYPDGTFRPQQNITRAETMTMINRVLERVPSEEDHLLSRRVMLTFPDCNPGDWFYLAVQEATNSHTYERAATEKNGDERWIALRDNRDWTKYEY